MACTSAYCPLLPRPSPLLLRAHPGPDVTHQLLSIHHLTNLPLPTSSPRLSELTRGLGCGGSPSLGHQAALESEEALRNMLKGADLVRGGHVHGPGMCMDLVRGGHVHGGDQEGYVGDLCATTALIPKPLTFHDLPTLMPPPLLRCSSRRGWAAGRAQERRRWWPRYPRTWASW